MELDDQDTGLGPILREWRSLVEATQPAGSHRWWLWGLSAVDFDRDGDVDLLVTQHGPSGTLALRSQLVERKQLRFENANTSLGLPSAAALADTTKPAVFDFNGDGFLDLCYSSARPRTCFLNRGGRGFEPIPFAFSPIEKLEKIADLDGDGFLDVANSTQRFLFVPQQVTFRREQHEDEVFARLPEAARAELRRVRDQSRDRFFRYWCSDAARLNGDERPDVVCGGFGSYGGSALGRYFLSGADGAMVERTAELGLPSEGAPVLVADLNGDGVDDVLVAAASAGGAFLSRGGRFEAAEGTLTLFLRRRGSYLQSIQTADLDQDGDLDLVASLPREREVVVYENLGQGAFREAASTRGWDAEPIAVADVDNDGLVDVCVGGPEDTITVLANRTKAPGKSLQIDLRMPAPNPFAVGADVEVWRVGDGFRAPSYPLVRMKARPDGLPLHVGLGPLGLVDIRVRFPRHAKSTREWVELSRVAVERRITITPEGISEGRN